MVNWLYLPTLTPAEMKVVDTIATQFRGDPGYVYNLVKEGQDAVRASCGVGGSCELRCGAGSSREALSP